MSYAQNKVLLKKKKRRNVSNFKTRKINKLKKKFSNKISTKIFLYNNNILSIK
jgi:hypothetical protein